MKRFNRFWEIIIWGWAQHIQILLLERQIVARLHKDWDAINSLWKHLLLMCRPTYNHFHTYSIFRVCMESVYFNGSSSVSRYWEVKRQQNVDRRFQMCYLSTFQNSVHVSSCCKPKAVFFFIICISAPVFLPKARSGCVQKWRQKISQENPIKEQICLRLISLKVEICKQSLAAPEQFEYK